MMFVGGIYHGKDSRKYLAVYNFQHDVYIKPPSSFGSIQHLDHFSYKRGNKNGGGDVFLINEIPDNPEVKINKEVKLIGDKVHMDEKRPTSKLKIYYQPELLKTVPEIYDIQHQILALPKGIEREVIAMSNADIVYFCGNNIAKVPRGSKIERVKNIIPKTEVKYIKPEKMLTGGKQWFVPSCKLQANIDFGKGCISGWIPIEGASFDGKFFTNYLSSPNSECEYCYAKRRHRTFPKTIYEFDKQRLIEELSGGCKLEFGNWESELGKPVDILRFGKRTETCAPFTRNQFIGTLEAMIETGTKGVITTKYLEYDKGIEERLKKTKSVVLHGVGNFDEFEKGAGMHECNNDFRLEQAVKYHEAGVNSLLYLHILGHKPPGKRENEFLKIAEKHKIKVQLLPIRFPNKDLTKRMTGQTWNHLKGGSRRNRNQSILPGFDDYGSYVFREKMLCLEKIHSSWLKMINNNKGRIRMCHHTLENTYCGGCFQTKGEITDPPPQDKKINFRVNERY
jgi:hypothetical protein